MSTIYLSYAPGDKDFGRGMRDALVRRGYEVATPEPRGNEPPTQADLAEQRGLIQGSAALIIVLSPLALSSPWVLAAMSEGNALLISGSKPVLSLVLGDSEPDSTSIALEFAVALARLYQHRLVVLPGDSFEQVVARIDEHVVRGAEAPKPPEASATPKTDKEAGKAEEPREAAAAVTSATEAAAEQAPPTPPVTEEGWIMLGGRDRAASIEEKRAGEEPSSGQSAVPQESTGLPPLDDTRPALRAAPKPAQPNAPLPPPPPSTPPPSAGPIATTPPRPAPAWTPAPEISGTVATTIADALRREVPSSASGEPLHFTAYHPATVATEEWTTLLVYSHIAAMLTQVQADAATFTELGSNPAIAQGEANRSIAEGVELTLEPHMEHVAFSPATESFVWRGRWHRSLFRLSGEAALAGTVQSGWIDVYADGLAPIARIDLSLPFASSGSGQQHAMQGLTVTSNLHDRVFISYNHADREAFDQACAMYNRFGIQIYCDEQLAAGVDYAAELGKMIAEANVFHLLWSRRSAASAECRNEWEQALLREPSERFIKPWFWKRPLVMPPKAFAQHRISFRYQHLKRKWWKPATW